MSLTDSFVVTTGFEARTSSSNSSTWGFAYSDIEIGNSDYILIIGATRTTGSVMTFTMGGQTATDLQYNGAAGFGTAPAGAMGMGIIDNRSRAVTTSGSLVVAYGGISGTKAGILAYVGLRALPTYTSKGSQTVHTTPIPFTSVAPAVEIVGLGVGGDFSTALTGGELIFDESNGVGNADIRLHIFLNAVGTSFSYTGGSTARTEWIRHQLGLLTQQAYPRVAGL